MRRLLPLAIVLAVGSGCTEIVDADPDRFGGIDASVPGPLDGAVGIDAPYDANEGICPGGCDDGIGCTLDRCNAQNVCEHMPSDEACGGPGDACVGTAVCDPEQSEDATGCVFGEGVDCDDGVACTADVCDPTDRSCLHVPQADRCDDDIACTEDECSPLAPRDGCVHTPVDAVCSSGFCNTGGFCDGTRGCVGGSARNCDDGSRCTVDSCDEVEAICRRTGVDADGDGHAAAQVGFESCRGDDCDDRDPDVHPGRPEVCGNDVDDDCDGSIDRGCDRCDEMPEVCPTGWSYENDGTTQRCTVSFTPPSGVRADCTELDNGLIGFSYPLTSFDYNCPPGSEFVPRGITGYCLWEVSIPPGGSADCGAVNAGQLGILWPCR